MGPSSFPEPLAESIAAFGGSAFYAKYVDACGLPILSSAKVADAALLEAAAVVTKLMQVRPLFRMTMIAKNVRVVIMAKYPLEKTTDVPEHSDLNTVWSNVNWDERARGLAPTLARPVSSAAEEDILCHTDDRYKSESILLHEFSHGWMDIGMAYSDPALSESINHAYKKAMSNNLWANTYADDNAREYFAEATQSWFNSNYPIPNAPIHNHVNTRAELLQYDTHVAPLLNFAFPNDTWRYHRHPESECRTHYQALWGRVCQKSTTTSTSASTSTSPSTPTSATNATSTVQPIRTSTTTILSVTQQKKDTSFAQRDQALYSWACAVHVYWTLHLLSSSGSV